MSIIITSNEIPPKTEATAAKAAEVVVETEKSKDVAESAPDKTEQEKPSESETDGTEETEADETEKTKEDEDESEGDGADDKAEKSDEEVESEKEKPKKKSGFQRRIDKLNSRVTSGQQEIEYWKEQALKGASVPKPAPEVVTAKADEAGKPDPSKYETHAKYIEDLTDWKIDQRDQKKRTEVLQTEYQKVVQTHNDRVKSFADSHDDWEETMENLKTVPNSPTVRQIITTSENGPELLYELAKNPVEATRIAKLSPIDAAREMGKLESRLASLSSPEKETPTKKLTNAPKPLEPVGTGKGSTKKSIYDPDISQAEFERLERDRMKKRRQG
jgi:hypothetical protein